MTDYLKPSEVEVVIPIPFVGVFRKAEVEAAIAAVVLASTVRDTWEPVTMDDLRAADEARGGEVFRWLSNPFLNFAHGIALAVERGFLARTGGEPGVDVDTLRVLPAALDLIARRPIEAAQEGSAP